MKILITGGAGYLGHSLVELLDNHPEINEIYVYDNLSSVHSNFFIGTSKFKKTSFIKGDILNSYALKSAVEGVDVVVHLAAYTAFVNNHQDNLRYEQINQWGTLNLVQAVRNAGNVKKFIYLSSSSVYGNIEGITKEHLPQPSNPYAKSKLEGEGYTKNLEGICDTYIIRAGNIFGFNPSFRKDSVINKFIFGSIVYEKIYIYGSGEQKRPFIEINNLCKTLLELLSASSKSQKLTINNTADFNASLIDIRNVLLNLSPTLEFQFLNENINFPGHTFNKELLSNSMVDNLIKSTYELFKDNLKF